MGVRVEVGVPTVGAIVGLGEAVAVGFGVGDSTEIEVAVAEAVAGGVGLVGIRVGVGVGLAWATRVNLLDTVTRIVRTIVTTTKKPTRIMTRPILILACSRIK
jgi:hypothetical protein